MFPALRHDPLVCSNDHENNINTSCTCKHIAYELFMARHIDYADSEVILRIADVRKPYVNCNAPLFLLLKSVRINACKGLYQGTLPVIYMSCCAKYDVSHFCPL